MRRAIIAAFFLALAAAALNNMLLTVLTMEYGLATIWWVHARGGSARVAWAAYAGGLFLASNVAAYFAQQGFDEALAMLALVSIATAAAL
jgi:hypothetical protein